MVGSETLMAVRLKGHRWAAQLPSDFCLVLPGCSLRLGLILSSRGTLIPRLLFLCCGELWLASLEGHCGNCGLPSPPVREEPWMLESRATVEQLFSHRDPLTAALLTEELWAALRELARAIHPLTTEPQQWRCVKAWAEELATRSSLSALSGVTP